MSKTEPKWQHGYDTMEEWYYSDASEEEGSKFSEELERLVLQEYPDIKDFFEEASVQGLQGGDFVTFNIGENHYTFEFNWESLNDRIFEYGPETAAEHYFEEIKEGVENGCALDTDEEDN